MICCICSGQWSRTGGGDGPPGRARRHIIIVVVISRSRLPPHSQGISKRILATRRCRGVGRGLGWKQFRSGGRHGLVVVASISIRSSSTIPTDQFPIIGGL